ncbi:hypothetical protein THRCLA_22055 [Thraustotheca clavata]|uniref:CC2D2A N-terminal C2 domain-containing protein n=1 Tax=Thraustotheca clavata TaxID=74557 RepID=A0A1V9ZD38_9STRA|nr:hypothetical protein THRCLA_22055 [Thraustotheca clavata]
MEDVPKPSRFIQEDQSDDEEEDNQKAHIEAHVQLIEHGKRYRLNKEISSDILVIPKIRQVLRQNLPKDDCGYDDDGIYRPETLECWLPRTVVDHVKERLTRESLSAVLSSVNSSIDPFATEAVRPLLVWHPPQVLATHWADIDKISAVYSELLVRIPKLHLTDHALFTLEDNLSHQLRFLHHEYMIKYAALTSLNHRYARLVEFSPLASIHDLYPEVNGFTCVLTELHDAFDEVYTKWNELKELRQKENTTLTPVLISLRQVDANEIRACISSFIEALKSRTIKDDRVVKCITALESLMDSSCLDYCIRLFSDISILAKPSHEESIRRRHISSICIYCELLVNDNVVMTTKKQTLTWPNFTVEFNEQITLRVVAKPSVISLRIYERSRPMSSRIPKYFYKTVCWTSLPIPLLLPGQAFESEICAAGAAPTDEWYQFCNEVGIPRKEWSSSYLNSSYYTNANRHVKGAIHVHLSWKTNQREDGRLAMQKIPIKLRTNKEAQKDNNRLIGHRPTQQFKTNDGTHFTHEKDFFTALASLPTLDPNAIDDQPAMRLQMYHEAKTKRLQELELFRLHPMTCFDLSPNQGPSTLKRHKLLQLRDKKLHDQAIFSIPIPLSEHSIAQLSTYLELVRPEVQAFNRGLATDKMNAHSKDSLEYTKRQLELRRQDFMERVRNNHNHCRRSNVSSPYSQLSTIVQEYPKPMLFKGWSPDFSGFSQLFARKRSLRPTKKAAPPLSGLLVDRPDECRIYVQIQRMPNAHIRRSAQENQASIPKKPQDNDESNSDAESNDDDVNSITCVNQIVVQVSFQGNMRKTSCSSGVHPTWMETVILPFKPPLNDWSSEALMRIRDIIQFNIMDQVIIEDQVTHTKDIQLRYLCGVSVPFTTLYYNHGEIIAQLRCQVPTAHLGYTRKSTKRKKDEVISNDSATYLSVMIKLDPALSN